MIKRLLLATLILSGNLYADRLQTNATADTYILDQRNVGVAKSFTISSPESVDVAFTVIQGTNVDRNYGGALTLSMGYVSTDWKGLLRFEKMADSMRARASGKVVVWDSARITLTENAAMGASKSLVLGIFELRRRFGEGNSNGATGVGASWYDYDSTSGTQNLWSDAGATNTVTDFVDAVLDTTPTLTSANTGAGTTISFKLPGTSVSDTINNSGVMFKYYTKSGSTPTVVIRSDDNATKASRPAITVYYREMEYPDFGGADTLLMKYTNASTQEAISVMTFDISTVTATATLATCSVYVYLNASYSDNGEGTIDIKSSVAMKPINIGTGTGGATVTGKLHWASWFENDTADSTWGTIGATNIGSVCNRSAGADDDKTEDTCANTVVPSGTGYKPFRVDTTSVRAYLNGTCSNFAVFLQSNAGSTDDSWFVLSSVEGANDPYLVIWYTPAATAPTKGTGRFGRAQDGRYLNVR